MMVLVWIIGTSVVVYLRRGAPLEGDLWKVFLVSLIPWAVVLVQLLHRTTRGIEQSFPAPPAAPAATARDYGLEQVPLWLGDEPKLNGAYVIDHIEFIERVCATCDWTHGTWEGVEMPSGMICDRAYLRKLIKPLTNKGFIVGYKHRSTGKLVCRDAEVIIEHFGLRQMLRAQPGDYEPNGRYRLA
jgi:hypothetical protein